MTQLICIAVLTTAIIIATLSAFYWHEKYIQATHERHTKQREVKKLECEVAAHKRAIEREIALSAESYKEFERVIAVKDNALRQAQQRIAELEAINENKTLPGKGQTIALLCHYYNPSARQLAKALAIDHTYVSRCIRKWKHLFNPPPPHSKTPCSSRVGRFRLTK